MGRKGPTPLVGRKGPHPFLGVCSPLGHHVEGCGAPSPPGRRSSITALSRRMLLRCFTDNILAQRSLHADMRGNSFNGLLDGRMRARDNPLDAFRPGVPAGYFPRLPGTPDGRRSVEERSERESMAVSASEFSRMASSTTSASVVSTHSRQMATSNAISTGPTNRPTIPIVLTPPIRPNNVGRKGRRIGPPTSFGRSVLSTMKSSIAPHAKRATAAIGLPLASK